jgi:hypothetical protein
MRFGVTIPPSQRVAQIRLAFCSDEPQSPRLTSIDVAGAGAVPLRLQRSRGRGGPYKLLIGGKIIGDEERANFGFPVNRFLPLIGSEPARVGRPSETRQICRIRAREALNEFDATLRNLRAVGAFRRQPDRRYEYKGRVPDVVDAAGDNVVNALIEDATRKSGRGDILRVVNRWLRAVGRVRLLPPRRISRTARIFEMRVRDTDSKRSANFADVGFGIGQALPVIVEGLRTPPGGMFLVQEPEIHLHPDAQLAMGDFLFDLARTGRRVVVETHSENLLLRIRHRVLQARTGGRRARLSASDVSVIHVFKSANGASHAKTLGIDALGQVQDWPADFMEEATKERMALMEGMLSAPGLHA